MLWTGAGRVGFIKPRGYGNLWGLVLTLGEFIRETGRESIQHNDAWNYLFELAPPVRQAVELAVFVIYRHPAEGGLRRKDVEKHVLPKLGMDYRTFRALACKGLQTITGKLKGGRRGHTPEPSVPPQVKIRKKFKPIVPGFRDT